MKGNFRTLLRRFCLEGSILGLKYFYLYPDRLTRCFWTVVMCMNTCLACLLTWLLYNRFEEMPTRITIENQYESLWSLPHPAVTLCSPNQVTSDAVRHFNTTLIDGRNASQSMNIEQTLPQLLGFFQLIDDINKEELDRLQELMNRNRYTALEVMQLMPQKCDNFLKICFFHGRQVPCKDLFKPIMTTHGMCCIFNSIYALKNNRNEKIEDFQPHRVHAIGVAGSLTVVVDYEPMNAVDRTVVNAGSTRVMVTDWTEFPSDDESRVVPPGAEAFNLLHATYTYCSEEVKTLPSFSRKCYFEDEKSLPHFGAYHNSDCDLLCLARQLERRCGCSVLYLPYLNTKRACNVTSIACIVDTNLQMRKWFRTHQCECPRDCESRRYRLELSVGNLDALPHIVNNPYENVTFTESTSILHLFFASSVHVRQKQETVMSLISFASNLGGVFGLCLGCSFLSIYEIFFFLYSAIRNHLRGRLRRAVLRTVHYHN